MNRRHFLQAAAAGGVAASLGGCAGLRPDPHRADDQHAVLVDLTRCIGCRECEVACVEANGLPEVADDRDLDTVERTTSETRWEVVNRKETSAGDVWVRRQCMHCVEPACAAACLTKALEKTDGGPVVWHADRCMGCRYCMIACPFDVPKFEYDRPVPELQKCQMCAARLGEGEAPACVEACPAEALWFGPRKEAIREAHRRIAEDPSTYHPEIYGEREAGGTNWLYLSPVPFEEVGLPTDLGAESIPERTRDFLTAVPVVLTLWPAFLLGLRQARMEEPAPRGPERLPTADKGEERP